MGLIIIGSEVESGLSSFSSSLETQKGNVSNLLEQVKEIANDTTLQGSAYSSIKMYFITQVYPNLLRLKSALSLLQEGNDQVLAVFHGQGFDGGTVLKEDELREKIASLKTSVSRLEVYLSQVTQQAALIPNIYQENMKNILQGSISNIYVEISILEGKILRMNQFNTGGSGKYEGAIAVLRQVSAAMSQFQHATVGSVCDYMGRVRLNVDPTQYTAVLEDIQKDIETKGYSIWELHTQEYYIDTFLANGTYDRDAYQKQLDEAIEKAGGKGSRNAVVAAASFFAMNYPRLHYFWGGKSYNSSENGYLGSANSGVGINPDWGIPTVVASPGSHSTGTSVNLGMDCSGYVAWALQTGGCTSESNPLGPSYIGAYDQAHNLGGEVVAIGGEGYDPARVQPGDIVYTDGHIGMVIDRNDTKMVYAHSAGSSDGTSIDIADLETGACLTRDGEKYFDYVVYMENYYQAYGQ